MPVIKKAWEPKAKPRDTYVAPGCLGWFNHTAKSLDALKRRRTDYAQQVGEAATLHKRLKTGDTKALLRYWQRHEKAVAMIIQWREGTGDRRVIGWPLELAAELDAEFRNWTLGD